MLGDVHAAEDVAQETMLRAWRHRRRLRDPRAGRAWLLRITANLCRDHLRRSRHAVSRAGPVPDEQPGPGASALRHTEVKDDLQQVREMMNQLPRRCRDVLYLRVFEELSHDEIAAVLGATPGSVKVSLSRARQKMRDMLEDPR